MLCNFGFSCLPLRRRTFFIALLLTFVAVAIKVRVVFRFLKHHPMPIHIISGQIHDADHENHAYFALECPLNDEIQDGTGPVPFPFHFEFGLQDDILEQCKSDFRDQRHVFD